MESALLSKQEWVERTFSASLSIDGGSSLLRNVSARLVVFPIKGRKWCFSRSVDPFAAQSPSGVTPTTLRGLWKKISSESKPINAITELLVDFISDKMNKAWMGLEIAPEGSMKNKNHGLGLKLLARVKPSEIFLKSISKEVTSAQEVLPLPTFHSSVETARRCPCIDSPTEVSWDCSFHQSEGKDGEEKSQQSAATVCVSGLPYSFTNAQVHFVNSSIGFKALVTLVPSGFALWSQTKDQTNIVALLLLNCKLNSTCCN
ncbi:hypothetical protein Bca52824_032152 [Brassica carinata]|uniref:Uncharacterized protein n=1 Tax=Brassica carinata TaxID=52824 RepID=A0A8X7V8D8_BRACI|nr:hypothetical protein Bca52824_032152 [Brassica carinata]